MSHVKQISAPIARSGRRRSNYPVALRRVFALLLHRLLFAALAVLAVLLILLAAALTLLILAVVALALLILAALLTALALLVLVSRTALLTAALLITLIVLVLVGHFECSLGNAPGDAPPNKRWNRTSCSGDRLPVRPPRRA
jgi:hypothetical protein